VISRRLIAVLTAAIAAFAAAALLLPHSPSALRELVVDAGPVAPVLAIGAWVVLVPALFPATVLAAAGGLAFGALGGSLLAVAGAVAGGLTAFALGRFGARGAVRRLVHRKPRFMRLQAVLERRGFTSVLAARLMPGVPAGALHYAAGASPVRPRSFTAAIAIGALVRTVPYALLGQGLASGSIASLLVAVTSIAIGGIVAIVLLRKLRSPLATATGVL
jgi:uncharacterized membrane protein YdjX (TVP38/TMEM64 family)